MNDTSFEVESKLRKMIQEKSPTERMKMGASMYTTSRNLIIRSILQDHPKITKSALQQKLFLKFYAHDVSPEKREEIIQYFAQNFSQETLS